MQERTNTEILLLGILVAAVFGVLFLTMQQIENHEKTPGHVELVRDVDRLWQEICIMKREAGSELPQRCQ